MTGDDERAALARRAAEAGAEVARAAFRTALEVETKTGATDVVTSVDRAAQARVVEVLEAAGVDEPVIGEEDGLPQTLPPGGPAWVVDPIDGTHNFVRGLPIWATGVAAVRDGEPVAAAVVAPILGDRYVATPTVARRNGAPIAVSEEARPAHCLVAPTMWWGPDRRDEYAAATRGIVERFGDLRRLGSAHVALAHVADGGLDGALTNLPVTPWDALPGVALVRAAGGRVTDLEGRPWRHDAVGLVASSGQVHEELVAAARAIDEAA